MTDVTGWELGEALRALRAELGEEPLVERAAPPRGPAWVDGVWRVVRVDAAAGRLTAAQFPPPIPAEGDGGAYAPR